MHTVHAYCYSTPITGLVVGSSMDTVDVTDSGFGVGVALGMSDVSDGWDDSSVADIMAISDEGMAELNDLHALLIIPILVSSILR